MSEPEVIVYGIHPWRGPLGPSGERVAKATYEAVRAVANEHPELSIGFVDLRSTTSWPAQRRLCSKLRRGLCWDDAPFFEVGGHLLRASDREDLARALVSPSGDETGSWEGFFSTPGGTLEYMRRVDRDIDTFNVSVLADPVWRTAPPDFRTGWTRFVEDWKAFFRRNEGFVARTFADVYDDTKVYEQHLKAWRERWTKLGGKPIAPPSPEADHNLRSPLPTPEGVGSAALGIGVLAAVLAGLYVVGGRSR